MEPSLAVTTYEISLWLHIVAAIAGLGATFAESILFPVAMRVDPRNLPYVHQVQLTINRYFANPALLIILVTGVYQVIEGNWEFGAFWISASFLIVFVLGGMIGSYFIPTDRRLGEMVAREIEDAGDGPVKLSQEYLSRSRFEGIMGALTGVLVVLAVFLMVVKPGA